MSLKINLYETHRSPENKQVIVIKDKKLPELTYKLWTLLKKFSNPDNGLKNQQEIDMHKCIYLYVCKSIIKELRSF